MLSSSDARQLQFIAEIVKLCLLNDFAARVMQRLQRQLIGMVLMSTNSTTKARVLRCCL